MDLYRVKKLTPCKLLQAEVPASKSLLNRALILAAFGKGDVLLRCGSYADDTEAMLSCLTALGIGTERRSDGVFVRGCGGVIGRRASLDVRSAGTAARFLTVALAFAGGDFTMTASAQMQRRPMEILSVLERAGVAIEYLGERGHFPFRMISNGIAETHFTVDTDMSTQYASGLLLAAAAGHPLSLRLTGSRTNGSYIAMTLQLMEQFGARCRRTGDVIEVTPFDRPPACIEIEADLSGACYFYAMALLLRARVCIPRVHFSTLQGDIRFLRLLEERGVRLSDGPEGILADGTGVRDYPGFDVDMHDFSDQALTVAALAPFARTPSHLTGLSHTRRQESDRVRAIAENLTRLGVPVQEEEDGVLIAPAQPKDAVLPSFGDHRVAMAFSLIGLKTGGVAIEDPLCCAKTFPDYFSILDRITAEGH